MPDRDPIQDLELLRTGGPAVTPLPPTEVRRLGDRRRRTRRTATTLGVAALVVAVAVPLGLTLRDDAPDGEKKVAVPPTVIDYPGDGVFVSDPADVSKLDGTSRAFKDFVAEEARRLADEGASCPDAAHGVTVRRYSTAGYALGAVNACGGNASLWVDGDGGWQTGAGTQDAWDCDTLAYLGVPTSFAGECFAEAGDFGPQLAGPLRLGMSRARLEQASLEIRPLEGSDCSRVVDPQSADPERGWFREGSGLVGIRGLSNDKTPERVGLGSSETKVRAAYPAATPFDDGLRVPLADGAAYLFTLTNGQVSAMSLVGPEFDCAG